MCGARNGVAAGYGMYLLIANVFARTPASWMPRGTICTICWDAIRFRSRGSRRWRESLPPSTSPAQRFRQAAGTLAGAALRRAKCGPPGRGVGGVTQGFAPAKVYADQLASYASNEICINWQASLVFLLAGELR